MPSQQHGQEVNERFLSVRSKPGHALTSPPVVILMLSNENCADFRFVNDTMFNKNGDRSCNATFNINTSSAQMTPNGPGYAAIRDALTLALYLANRERGKRGRFPFIR
jgi:hypothetical protein